LSAFLEGGDIENIIADGHAAPAPPTCEREDTAGKVVEREVALG
jgi:hypothetical protein